MRNLKDVIGKMLEVSTNEDLNKVLRRIQSSCDFTAPELMYMRWDLVSEALMIHIPNPVESDETVKILSIFSTKSEDEIKSNV